MNFPLEDGGLTAEARPKESSCGNADRSLHVRPRAATPTFHVFSSCIPSAALQTRSGFASPRRSGEALAMVLDHLSDEFGKRTPGHPVQALVRPGRIADQKTRLGWAE